MDQEAIIYFSMLALVLFVPICFVLIKVKKTSKRATLILQSLGLSLIVLVIATIVSFLVYTDALNFLAIFVLYSIAFVLSSLINVGVILIKTRQ